MENVTDNWLQRHIQHVCVRLSVGCWKCNCCEDCADFIMNTFKNSPCCENKNEADPVVRLRVFTSLSV